jgi:hypothetical protein
MTEYVSSPSGRVIRPVLACTGSPAGARHHQTDGAAFADICPASVQFVKGVSCLLASPWQMAPRGPWSGMQSSHRSFRLPTTVVEVACACRDRASTEAGPAQLSTAWVRQGLQELQGERPQILARWLLLTTCAALMATQRATPCILGRLVL